jgi:hypothetical protein
MWLTSPAYVRRPGSKRCRWRSWGVHSRAVVWNGFQRSSQQGSVAALQARQQYLRKSRGAGAAEPPPIFTSRPPFGGPFSLDGRDRPCTVAR